MRILLNNMVTMPMLGLGTWRSKPGNVTKQAVLWALDAGYRHIDTAAIYGNEESIGDAVRKSGVARKDIFITTKLWNSDHGDVRKAVATSLRKLQMNYVDLYLIHFPVPERVKSWKAFEELYHEKKIRAIGVSNFTIRHLTELLSQCKIVPAVNQVEFSPFLHQKELLDFCVAHRIQLEAYSPLSQGEKLNDSRIVSLSQKYGKTPAQIILRWFSEKNIVAIPKSVTKERIEENFGIIGWKISPQDMEILDNLNEDYRTCWDPTNAP